jgi:glycine/D-amino acid oxidase-like deaminating enzyme/nitrite reductase/ring-hydroxylating ferredoxin subunit
MRTMPKDGGTSSSIWIDADVPSYDTAPEAETDICIVGAGIAGLTTAFELARRGVRVSVLDDGPIGGGETGRTSAHLASAVDDHYYELEAKFGAGGAKLVAESHATAIDYIEAMVRELEIDCDFQRVDGYLISPPGEHEDRRTLDREYAAAQRAGLECELVDHAPVPFDSGPALRFANQAEFHPLRYLRAVAEGVIAFGGHIHTGVHVEAVTPGRPLHVKLAGGRTMLARVLIDASNGAFTSQLNMPLRQAAYRTYVLAFAIPEGYIPHALIWDTLDPYHYIRVARGPHGGEMLIVGGNDHRTGQGEPERQWKLLENWTRQWFPRVGHIVARWSGQILEPADMLAHIGPSPDHAHVYIVTGDSGNGLTHGTIAGLMLPEMLHGQHPRWARVYDPKRSHLRAAGTLVKEAVQSSAPYADWLRGGDVRHLDDIPHGEGAVIRRGLHMIAAYRDEAGECHLRSATCPHLRGVVHWNAAEKTWDCPCHGSRFDRYGRVVNGPSSTDLAPIEAPAADKQPVRAPVREEPRVETTAADEVPVRPLERE